jgi:hypothetical protein
MSGVVGMDIVIGFRLLNGHYNTVKTLGQPARAEAPGMLKFAAD